ncbi:MAG: 2OG-Fe(II) oxygenase [Elusimicrobia bacterium]|nr:2OG-Fe(II) oxygenase [Elusimicrobiota bacterium]
MKLHREAEDVFSFQLFSKSFCESVLESSHSWGWHAAGVYVPGKRIFSDSRSCQETEIEDAAPLRKAFAEKFKKIVAPALELCWQWRVRRWEARLIRYPEGGYYKHHVDYYPEGGRPSRLISLVCYLNDGFLGGRTVFLRQNHAVVPQTGKAIVFPAGITHPHAAESIASGAKYVLAAWFS